MENKKKDKREEKKMIYEKIRDKIISMFPDMYKKINITLSERDKKSGKKPDIRNTEETIEYLLANECSMSRLGDGEFILIFGGRENYQKYDKELVKKLVEILHSNLSNHIVCISDVFGNLAERNDENKKYYYSAKIDLISGGNYGYSFRVMPKHEMLLESANLDLIKWVEK